MVFQLLNEETLKMYIDTAFIHLFVHHAFIGELSRASYFPVGWGQSWTSWTKFVSHSKDTWSLQEAPQSKEGPEASHTRITASGQKGLTGLPLSVHGPELSHRVTV